MDRWAHNPQSGRLDACFPLYKPDLKKKRASVKRYNYSVMHLNYLELMLIAHVILCVVCLRGSSKLHP